MKVYAYKNCSTCQKAIKYLDARGAKYELLPIVEQPPTLDELRKMAGYVGGFKRLFNTSGQLYRELKIAERELEEASALALLAEHGKLVKRPFLLTEKGGTVGFKPEEWDRLL